MDQFRCYIISQIYLENNYIVYIDLECVCGGMHGAILTGIFLNGCTFSDSRNYKYCGELDDFKSYFCYMQ